MGYPYLGIWDYLGLSGTICDYLACWDNDLKALFLNDTIAKRPVETS